MSKPDTFRRQSVQLTPEQATDVHMIKTAAKSMEQTLRDAAKDAPPAKIRDLSVALQHLETAVMWAVKGVTHRELEAQPDEIKVGGSA